MPNLSYYKYYDEYEKGKFEVFVEAIDDNYLTRQCELSDIVYSCSIYSTYSEPVPILGEMDVQWVLDNNPEALTKITASEFEEKWKLVLDNNRQNWQQIKSKFPIGSEHVVKTLMFYPQGVLLTKDNAFFLMEDEDYQKVVPIQKMYPNTDIHIQVIEHLENSQWLYAKPSHEGIPI